MRLLFVTPYYIPDGGPSAPLYTMLCEALAQKGHDVTVISAVPHYPSGFVPPEHRTWRVKTSRERGVKVIRVPVPSMDRTKLNLRLLQLTFYQLWAALMGLPQRFDAAIFNNPFFMVGIPFTLLKFLRGKPVVYSIHDVYPDVGIKLGIFRSKPVISAATALERFCVNQATFVRILSESFAHPMHNLGVPDSKMVLIYDWVDTQLIQPLPRENDFAIENDLIDKFVVLYAGNIGLSQGLENILAVAQQLMGDSGIQFLFVGDGAGKSRLVDEAKKLSLANVKFLPFQPRECLPKVLATADISLVTLQKGMGKGSLPSKSFSILASGRPILASVDQDSDIARLVERAKAGVCVPPEDPHSIAEAILHLKKDPSLRKVLGENGRSYALSHHSPPAAAEQFEDLLRKAVYNKQNVIKD